jgi:hypothetical protein
VPIAEASEDAWRAMAAECTMPDMHGRRWYRARTRPRPPDDEDHDDLAQEYEHRLNEAHAVRTLLVQRDGP